MQPFLLTNTDGKRKNETEKWNSEEWSWMFRRNGFSWGRGSTGRRLLVLQGGPQVRAVRGRHWVRHFQDLPGGQVHQRCRLVPEIRRFLDGPCFRLLLWIRGFRRVPCCLGFRLCLLRRCLLGFHRVRGFQRSRGVRWVHLCQGFQVRLFLQVLRDGPMVQGVLVVRKVQEVPVGRSCS